MMQPYCRASRKSARWADAHRSPWRRGFTLIELLVVLVVLLIVSLIGFTVINATAKSDLVSGGARNAQSFLEGARDRALHAELPRGVRFLTHRNEPGVIDRYVYVGPAGTLSTSSDPSNVVQISGDGAMPTPRPRRIVIQQPLMRTVWERLRQRNLIVNGAWIKLRVGNNPPVSYAITIVNVGGAFQFHLTKDFVGPPSQDLKYELSLAAAVLPNQEPRQFPGKAVIDVSRSRFGNQPLANYLATTNGALDVMLSPRGTVIGNAARAGRIQLIVRSLDDFEAGRALNDPDNDSPTLVLVITTQTGSVSTHTLSDPFNPNDPAGVESE